MADLFPQLSVCGISSRMEGAAPPSEKKVKNKFGYIAPMPYLCVLNQKKMAKVIRKVFKTDTLSLHECNDGYYLYDYVVGMNISMRAKTEQDAYIEALMYYQKRLVEVKKDYKDIHEKVQNFIGQFIVED